MSFQSLQNILARLPPLSSQDKEAKATDGLASGLHQTGVTRFWTNPQRAALLSAGARIATGWRGTKIYDLSWANNASVSTPECALNVKLVGGSNPSQEPQLFLADALLAALDHNKTRVPTAAVAVMRGTSLPPTWVSWFAHTGKARLVVDPANCRVASSPLALRPSGEAVLESDADFSRILTGGTNGRLVGFYNRPGCLVAEFDVIPVIGANASSLWIAKAVHFSGSQLKLQEWLP